MYIPIPQTADFSFGNKWHKLTSILIDKQVYRTPIWCESIGTPQKGTFRTSDFHVMDTDEMRGFILSNIKLTFEN